MPLPNDYSFTCLKILQHFGLTEKLHIDADGFFYDLRVIFHYSTLIGTYHQKFQKMTSTFLHSKDTILQYENQRRMFKYSQAQLVVTNTYSSIFQKLMKKYVVVIVESSPESLSPRSQITIQEPEVEPSPMYQVEPSPVYSVHLYPDTCNYNL